MLLVFSFATQPRPVARMLEQIEALGSAAGNPAAVRGAVRAYLGFLRGCQRQHATPAHVAADLGALGPFFFFTFLFARRSPPTPSCWAAHPVSPLAIPRGTPGVDEPRAKVFGKGYKAHAVAMARAVVGASSGAAGLRAAAPAHLIAAGQAAR